MGKSIVSEEKKKPVLDEQTLGRLLEAAYVLQEHNRELRELELGLDLKRDKIEAQAKAESGSAAGPAKAREPLPAAPDYTSTLAQIVATQHQIQLRNLTLEEAVALVTQRVTEIVHSGGAAIGMLDGKKVRYRAVSGSMTLKPGAEVTSGKALCLPCIRNAQVFRCPDVNPEFLVDAEECRRRGIQSLIAVPIFHEGVAAGGLEIYYSIPHGFTEQDVHTCQLMAGLVTEALAREEEYSWKQSLANERTAMLDAIEKLKPNVPSLTEQPRRQAESLKVTPASDSHRHTATCSQCGNEFKASEQFCGQCGSPRSGANLQNKIPVPPQVHKPSDTEFVASQSSSPAFELPPEISLQIPDFTRESMAAAQTNPAELFTPHASSDEPANLPEIQLAASTDLAHDFPAHADDEPKKSAPHEELALANVSESGDWSSAASAREFLEQLADDKPPSGLARFWETRRGDIYLAVAILLVACVIRWGIWSNHSVSATNTPSTPTTAAQGHHKPAPIDPTANLSLFDRMLISVGLADPPEVPEDRGDPSTKVWIDTHTALYYCPGAELYGKTAKGKYASQRDAQLDEYQPAYRKPCN